MRLSHKFIPLDERGSKFQHNSFKSFPPVDTYPNRNLPPFPFNPNFPPPFQNPIFEPLFQPYHHQYSYPPPLMSIPTRTSAYYGMESPFHPLKTEHARTSTLPPATSTISIEGTPNCQPIPVRISYRHDEKMAKCIKRSNIIIPCLPINCTPQSRMIDVCLLNARSIRNETLIINNFVIDNDIDI